MAEEDESAAAEHRVRSSVARQGLMRTLGARLGNVTPGGVEIALRPDPAMSRQHGFVHAGTVSAIADTAAGYAALTLMPPGRGVLTTEFKINLLAPATGSRILACSRAGSMPTRMLLRWAWSRQTRHPRPAPPLRGIILAESISSSAKLR